MKLPRVILADDHAMLLEALCKLLQPRYEIVATVSDGHALLEDTAKLKPDVVVADIAMPTLGGMEAGLRLKQDMPGVKLIFLTMNEDPDLAVEAMASGASGYLLKKSAGSELFLAIDRALKGKSYITPQIARGMQDAFVRNPIAEKHAKTLTRRQREVIQLLAQGRTMKEAAVILKVTPRTVAFHKYRIMEEQGLKTTADLIRFAFKSRIVEA